VSVPSDSGKKGADLRFLFLSPSSRYALLGLRALVRESGGTGFHLASSAARRAKLPANTLSKIFQRLARRGLLVSQRGPGGGYALARTPSSISLADILLAVQDLVPGGRHCLLHNRLCDDGEYCLVHRHIIEADRQVLAGMESVTLEDLVRSGGWDW
jgi:Rrf2 family iron-sulfur cluster assembly transcriptional regulator